jgi:hypothetical protein
VIPQDYGRRKTTISALLNAFDITPSPQVKPNVDYKKFDNISDVSSSDDEALRIINEQLYTAIRNRDEHILDEVQFYENGIPMTDLQIALAQYEQQGIIPSDPAKSQLPLLPQ